jgi:hypothetical protein
MTDDTRTYIDRYDWAQTKPTTAVVTSVATATSRHPEQLPVLYEFIDPDALNTLFTSGHGDSRLEVTFSFDGGRVTLRGDGTLTVVHGTET